MEIYLELSQEEVHREIPYAVICETRYGSRWDTSRRRRRWTAEFTEAERRAASELFPKAHNYYVGRGVPERVKMKPGTLRLWQKLGDFCASI